MSSSVATTVGGVMVVTQVHRAPDAAAQEQQYVGIRKFNKGRPQVLGTIQIMVGVVVLLLGIIVIPSGLTIGVFTGSFAWGAALYIAAGSLTVAAGTRLTSCLVKAALIVSVIASVAATISTIMYIMDAVIILGYGRYTYQSRMRGVSGVLAVFSFLELIVAITVAGYACNAICCCNDPTTVLVVPAAAVASGESADVNMEQVQFFKSSEEDETMAQPPPYSTV
ncbi:membrane-spanning 4-domains subfamily A member 4D-like isoform X2 [Cynoglossus semilaevis]|uniref:membrane-spanning 4-domains subfamily A member 4D-like isoform X2 n=1 Tax=Cynoglossus semilaevis TaxID=244447 RepID=UPI000D631441|nr:membrane-spanning 4-domains subfamily A member 4D-like isoform X2 [Cynoglossus semilaevis]